MLPSSCHLCGARLRGLSGLCAGCLRDLPRAGSGCIACAVPLTAPGLCGACLRAPPPVMRTRAALLYRFPVDRLVTAFKYHGALQLAAPLARLAALTVEGSAAVDLLLPVPPHRLRLRERGYDQAALLAHGVGSLLGLPTADDLVIRRRATAVQAGLDAEARRHNVRGSFELRGRVSGLRIAVVDDVLTTGATIWELARELRAGGAAEVHAWVCARTPPPG